MSTATDLSLLKSAVADTLGLQATAAEETANSQAEQLKNEGSAGEIAAYNTAAQIAEKNAALEGVFGDIQEFQQQRLVGKNTGTASNEIAGGGFSLDSGSAVAILRESLQQGYLATQLNRTQTQQNAGGYLEQAAAGRAEGVAVQSQIAASNTLSSAEQNAAAVASANAASESTALQNFIKANPAQTPEEAQQQSLVTSTLTSPLNGPATLPSPVDPSTAGNPFSFNGTEFTPTTGLNTGTGIAPTQTLGDKRFQIGNKAF